MRKFRSCDILRRLLVLLVIFAGISPARSQVNTDQVVNIGRNAMYFEDYVLAIQYFNQAIQSKPYIAWPYFYRSIAKLNLEDYRGAEADAGKAIELHPFIADAWEVRGVARQNLGKNAEAIDDYNEALKLLPNNRQLTYNLAQAMISEKRYDEADSVFTDILKHYPGFENGYLGRARLNIARGDTVAAIADIDKTLALNNNSFNAHAMRSDIAITGSHENLDTAMIHLDEAIRLQPRVSGLYLNRAYLRYRMNDWMGAMSDYDYSLELDPTNVMAMFNRALLEMEVNAMDKALEDLSGVLRIHPDDLRARYNRSVVYASKNMFDEAIADVNYVIEAFPNFPSGYWMRSDYLKRKGDNRAAMRDYDKASALTRALTPDENGMVDDGSTKSEVREEDLVRREFASLLTVDDNTDFRDEYNNTSIRGRIQDRNIQVQTEPMFELTYYTTSDNVGDATYYFKEVDDINATRGLRFVVLVSNHIPVMSDEDFVDKHFKSIEYYNSYLSTHKGRTIDYIGRAMDFMTVRNYDAALADIDRAIALTSDFSPAYMLKAQTLWHKFESESEVTDEPRMSTKEVVNPSATRGARMASVIDEILANIDKAIELSPRNPFLYFNKGNMLMKRNDIDDAMAAYDKAIELRPNFAQAYFNRGYINLSTGNRAMGIDDLSKAGELGIVSAYNLIKRMAH